LHLPAPCAGQKYKKEYYCRNFLYHVLVFYKAFQAKAKSFFKKQRFFCGFIFFASLRDII